MRVFGRPTLLTLGAGFDIELTGRQNIYLNAAYLALSKREIDWRVDEIIEFSEFGDFIDVPLRQYSDGMRARLGFAIASHVQLDILLLDEVFSVGDPAFQEKSRAKLEELIDLSSSIVIVSHDLLFLEKTCTRVAWLDGGQLVDFGDAENVLSRYRETSMAPRDEPCAPCPEPGRLQGDCDERGRLLGLREPRQRPPAALVELSGRRRRQTEVTESGGELG